MGTVSVKTLIDDDDDDDVLPSEYFWHLQKNGEEHCEVFCRNKKLQLGVRVEARNGLASDIGCDRNRNVVIPKTQALFAA